MSFHPKTYIINKPTEDVLYIGSSNMSRTALINGIEWNYRLTKELAPKDYIRFEEEFNYIFEEKSDRITDEIL